MSHDTAGEIIVRRAETIRRTGLSQSTLERYERQGIFPRRIQLGPRAVGWRESEINKWITDRVRGSLALVAAE